MGLLSLKHKSTKPFTLRCPDPSSGKCTLKYQDARFFRQFKVENLRFSSLLKVQLSTRTGTRRYLVTNPGWRRKVLADQTQSLLSPGPNDGKSVTLCFHNTTVQRNSLSLAPLLEMVPYHLDKFM